MMMMMMTQSRWLLLLLTFIATMTTETAGSGREVSTEKYQLHSVKLSAHKMSTMIISTVISLLNNLFIYYEYNFWIA